MARFRPSPEDVEYVIAATKCGQGTAQGLLRRWKDPDLAIKMFNKNKSVYDELFSRLPRDENAPASNPLGPGSSPSLPRQETVQPAPTCGNADNHSDTSAPRPTTPSSSENCLEEKTTTPDLTPTSDASKEGESDKPVEEEENCQKGDWSFTLPRIPPTEPFAPGGPDGTQAFNLHYVLSAVQNGHGINKILTYLEHYFMPSDEYDEETPVTKDIMNGEVAGIPAMFYVAERNDSRLLREWVKRGGDVCAVYRWNNIPIPLLGFVIIQARRLSHDTSPILSTLLSLGASADVVPPAFYQPPTQDLPPSGPEDKQLLDAHEKENKHWCRSPGVRTLLAQTMHLTMRYHLSKSIQIKPPGVRHRQVARRRKAEALLGIHYFLIGQTHAATTLTKKLLVYMMDRDPKRPLVLVFAGPSGHGKTELARKLGRLLSLKLEIVDCTIYNEEKELFGPRAPYVGSERGSPLNNFLARQAGKPGIVFLDEFEKTSANIHQALLLPFGNGEYQDRRSLETVDCSRMIWILATNALDETIAGFCQENEGLIFSDDKVDEVAKEVKGLTRRLKEEFMEKFKAPLTGRITAFLPFLNFSPDEQAVIAHKYIIELAKEVAKPACMGPGHDKENMLGNIHLEVRRDASVCAEIARESYHRALGARSLIGGVECLVKEPLVEQYLDEVGEIHSEQEEATFRADVVRDRVEMKRVREYGRGDERDGGEVVDKDDTDGEL